MIRRPPRSTRTDTLFPYSTLFRSVEGNEPNLGFALPGATQSEYRAALLWSMRAGLNVAALQCQFEPTLQRCHRSEEHTSELQSLMRISYAVFCLKKKTKKKTNYTRLRISKHTHQHEQINNTK